jgi:hypothetical protein
MKIFSNDTRAEWQQFIILLATGETHFFRDSDKTSSVLDQMKNTLREGGYLITGHTELHAQNLHGLRTRVFPESAAYQKSSPVISQTEEKQEAVENNSSSKGIREKNPKSKVQNLNLSMEDAQHFLYNGAYCRSAG